jgi:hypothetical protein
MIMYGLLVICVGFQVETQMKSDFYKARPLTTYSLYYRLLFRKQQQKNKEKPNAFTTNANVDTL